MHDPSFTSAQRTHFLLVAWGEELAFLWLPPWGHLRLLASSCVSRQGPVLLLSGLGLGTAPHSPPAGTGGGRASRWSGSLVNLKLFSQGGLDRGSCGLLFCLMMTTRCSKSPTCGVRTPGVNLMCYFLTVAPWSRHLTLIFGGGSLVSLISRLQ